VAPRFLPPSRRRTKEALDSVAFRRGLIDRATILSETAASELANVRGDPKVTEALAYL
jgi:hypothetical protein